MRRVVAGQREALRDAVLRQRPRHRPDARRDHPECRIGQEPAGDEDAGVQRPAPGAPAPEADQRLGDRLGAHALTGAGFGGARTGSSGAAGRTGAGRSVSRIGFPMSPM